MPASARGLQQHSRQVGCERLSRLLLALAEAELEAALGRAHDHQPRTGHLDRRRRDFALHQSGHAERQRDVRQGGQPVPLGITDLDVAGPQIERTLPSRPGQQRLADPDLKIGIEVVESLLEIGRQEGKLQRNLVLQAHRQDAAGEDGDGQEAREDLDQQDGSMAEHNPHGTARGTSDVGLTPDQAIREFCLKTGRRSCPRLR